MRLFDLLAIGLVVGAFVMVYRLFAADTHRVQGVTGAHVQGVSDGNRAPLGARASDGKRNQATNILTRIEREINGILDGILPNSKKIESWTVACDPSSWRAEDEAADAFDPIVPQDRCAGRVKGETQVRHGAAGGVQQNRQGSQVQVGGDGSSGQAGSRVDDSGQAGAAVDLSAQVSASPDPARWRCIIIHHSGTSRGNAAIFDRYHRKERKLADGLVYHFVIGNGTDSDDGFIEEGPRWRKGIGGPQTKNTGINNNAIGICLVGDFDENTPSAKQKESLRNLISYLCARYSIRTEDVLLRSKVPGEKISSPGLRFSME